jgi:hypothetical protein
LIAAKNVTEQFGTGAWRGWFEQHMAGTYEIKISKTSPWRTCGFS